MNEINAAQRLRLAAFEQAEADKVHRLHPSHRRPGGSAQRAWAARAGSRGRVCNPHTRCLSSPTQVRVVKAAEADAEAKYLAGSGIARQRQAIIAGLRERCGGGGGGCILGRAACAVAGGGWKAGRQPGTPRVHAPRTPC